MGHVWTLLHCHCSVHGLGGAFHHQRSFEGHIPGVPRDRDAPRGGGQGGPQRQLTGEKASGTVKFFNAMKGFGFIQRDDGQPDAFVHISAVERAGMTSLNEGDRLEFELEVDRRGKYAAVNLTSLA